MQEAASALGMGAGFEDGARILLEELQPACDIGGMTGLRFWCQSKIGAQKCRSQFCDEFLVCIALVAKFLAAEVTIKAGLMFRPMNEFMGKGGVEGFSTLKACKAWHLNVIA